MAKKEFTSFDVAATVRELRERILPSRVSNIYQVNQKTLLLKLHVANSPAFQLVLEAGRRLHLTSYSLEKPLRPSGFCMALRRHLRNAHLTSIEQSEFERIIIFSLETHEDSFKLVLEVFGEGNIILVGKDDRILQALTYKRMRDRAILRGESFRFPPPAGKNPLKINLEQVATGLKAFGDVEVVRALVRFLGIGGQYSEETLIRANIEKNRNCANLSLNDVDAIFNSLHSLLIQVTVGDLEPCVVVDKSELIDVNPVRLKLYTREGIKFTCYTSFNEALDEFYVRISAVDEVKTKTKASQLRTEAERLRRIVAEQEKLLTEGQSKSELERRIGDTLYLHNFEIQALLDELSRIRQEHGNAQSAVANNSTAKKSGLIPNITLESVDNKGLIATVSVDGLTFELKTHKTVFENANESYQRAKEIQLKIKGARKALEDSQSKLSIVLEEIRDVEALEKASSEEALSLLERHKTKVKKWFEKFRWFVSSDGHLVVGGKDAVSNEILVKKYCEADDVVFHADIVGAPFVVVKVEGRAIDEQCLKEAGEFAASFSRGWREGFGSVDVYWVKPEQLSKGGPSGESVGHGAFVVRGQRNWMRGVKLELALGILLDTDGSAQFIGGPVNAVNSKTGTFVRIAPGDLSGKELLRVLLRTLAGKIPREASRRIANTSIEEIREYVPFTRGRIVRD